MDPRAGRVEGRLERLEAALDAVEARLQALEGAARLAAAPAGAPETVAIAPLPDALALFTIAGRTLVVFAGAYLLRALTDAGLLAPAAGLAAGLAYAAVWLALAARAAPRRRLEAEVYGATATAIALPLIWEGVARTARLTPEAGALLLGLAALAALAVAWHGRLHGLAWVASLGAGLTAGALFVGGGAALHVAGVLVVLGVVTLWLGYVRDWYGPRWPMALLANLAVAGVAARAIVPETGEAPAGALAAQFLLVVAYLSTIAARTLVRGRRVVPFEVAQSAAVLVVGLGGAVMAAGATGVGTVAIGAGCLALGAAAYAVAFAFVARRPESGVNFYFYTSLGLALALAGSILIVDGWPRAAAWAALGALMPWLGIRAGRRTLLVHGAVWIAAAAVGSGLAGAAIAGFFGDAAATRLAPTAALGLAAAIAGFLTPADEERGRLGRLSRLIFAVVIAGGAAGLLIVLGARALGAAGAGPGALATLRTVVVAATALGAAGAGRAVRLAELRWLAYPLLAAGGVKLLTEDLRSSPSALLVVALALYGGALIAAPRIFRQAAAAGRTAAGGRRQSS